MNLLSRRTVLSGLAFSAVTLPAYGKEAVLTATQAHKGAGDGKLVFVDIRTPQEWKETGIASTAHPVSMHQAGFLQKLDKLIGGDKSKKIALICATGSRSAYIQTELKKRGYSNAISVAEGMIGGPNGKGWIPRGMPIKKVTAP